MKTLALHEIEFTLKQLK